MTRTPRRRARPHQVIELQPEPDTIVTGFQFDHTSSSHTALIAFSMITALVFLAWLVFPLHT